MRTRVLNLLLAVLLAAAAGRLWTAQRAPLPQLPAAPPAAAPVADAAGAGSGGEGTDAEEGREAAPTAVAEGYDVIAARDLFSAARGVVPPAPPAAGMPPAKPVPQPKLTLAGVVILDGEKTAYLSEGSADARPRKVREGDAFAGGTVKVIRPDGITFLFGGSEITIPLRTPKDTGAARRPGDMVGAPIQPDVVPRRVQPGAADATGQLRRPPQAIPGVPRLVPPPDEEEEPVYEDDMMLEDEDGMLIDDGDMIDEDDLLPEDFEEMVE